MRWESEVSPTGNEVYHLYKDDKKILTLTLHPFSGTARVECENEKRIFLIRKEGFLRNKIVIRNEYGFKIGELGHENKEPFITVNSERFFYSIQNSPLAELILYKESKEKPVVSCGLRIQEGSSTIRFKKDKHLEETSNTSLIMALCWYMFLPVKENLAKEEAIA